MAIICATVYIPMCQIALSCSSVPTTVSPKMDREKVRQYGRYLIAPLWTAPDSAIKIIWDEPKPKRDIHGKPIFDKNGKKELYYPNQETRERILGYLQADANKNARGREPRTITYEDVDRDVKNKIRRLGVDKLSNILIGKNDKYKGRILLEFRDNAFYKDHVDKDHPKLDTFYIKIVTDVSMLAQEGLVDLFYDDWRKSYDEWNDTREKKEAPISREAFFKDNHVKRKNIQEEDNPDEYSRYNQVYSKDPDGFYSYEIEEEEREEAEREFKEQCRDQSEWTVISMHDSRNDRDVFLQTGLLRY